MKNFKVSLRFFAVLFTAFLCAEAAFAAKGEEICIYADETGRIVQVNSAAQVPPQFRDRSRCFDKSENQYLAKPEEIKLSGNVRKEDMSSSIGRIQLRWPRKVELLFGRTPQRAMADAAMTASRALKASGFPADIQTLQMNWNVVFMDEDVPETQIPSNLVSNCHPAWMTPPANLYIVAQRVAAGCGGGSSPGSQVADSELAHILLHEIGHSVEFRMLGGNQSRDRMQSEGFASWFEAYASDYSSIIKKGSIKDNYFSLAKQAIAANPNFYFQGSAYDYARASMYFHAIASKKGVRGVSRVYEVLASENVSFFDAVKKAVQWDQKKLNEEVLRLLN